MSQVTRGNAEKKELIKSCVMELLKEDAFIKEITGKVIAAVEKHFNKKFEDYEKRTSDLVHKNQLYRRAVMDRRKLLKGTHISIVEDLTRSRYLCDREANKVFGFRNVWVMDGVSESLPVRQGSE
ncbi:hypothetical protein QE152_g24968 [Popillia japonica]|uniref:Uncharacterized protein n=1 Tax=Popillia japonica TaxID=7064 RepID=A0AAW1K227_POPJA